MSSGGNYDNVGLNRFFVSEYSRTSIPGTGSPGLAHRLNRFFVSEYSRTVQGARRKADGCLRLNRFFVSEYSRTTTLEIAAKPHVESQSLLRQRILPDHLRNLWWVLQQYGVSIASSSANTPGHHAPSLCGAECGRVSIASSSANTPGQNDHLMDCKRYVVSQSLLRQRILPDLAPSPTWFRLRVCLNRFFVSEYSRTRKMKRAARAARMGLNRFFVSEYSRTIRIVNDTDDAYLSQSLLRQRILPDREVRGRDRAR